MRLVIIVVISLSLIFLDKQAKLSSVRNVVLTASWPIQRIINWPYHLAHETHEIIAGHNALVEENQQLKAQSVVLQLRLEKLLALEQENKALRALLSSSEYLPNQVMVAQLLSINSGVSKQEFVIDKGVHQHLYQGQPVIDSYGVVGQVIEVGPQTSRVMLVTDSRSRVPVENTKTGLRAIAKGGNSQIVLDHVPKSEQVKADETFVTSGLGGVFPQGYPVAKVNAIENKPGETFAEITLRPIARLNRTRLVLLLWPVAPPPDIEEPQAMEEDL